MDPLLLAPALHPDQDFLPASPHLYDASPNPGAPYDSFDFPDAASHFPHTPSYNGSYQNSPYSNYSDLPAIDGTDDGLHLFADNPSGISITEEYDPAEYDVPSSGGPLILDEHYMNSAHVSVSVTPPLNDYSSPNAFDHASPASSNGLEDDGHSHASSNSSYMHPPSPRPDISQSFQDSLSFHSPAWPAGALPDDRRSPPLSKPQSPPQLVIPDTTSPGGTGVESPPTINAPDGDGGLIGSGPTLQIVPATPVSGGGVTAQNVPFQDTLANLRQGASGNSAGSDAQDWTHHQQFGAQGGQFADQAFSFPGSSSSSALADDGAQQSQQQFQRGQQYLLPQAPPRSRSLSDTSLRPAPVWDTVPVGDGRQGGTVNMNDVLPGPGQGQSSDPLQQNYRHPSSAGPHQTSFGMNSYNQYASDYLTVETGAIRRAKSDGGAQRPMHTRQARSLDIRPTNSLSPNPGMLFPPPGPAQQDFLRQQQFLHPTEPMPSIRGHHRRSSSSGSRERGIGGMMGIGGGVSMGGIAGWSGSQTSSARASPYPSPSASPRPGYGALPSQDLGLSGLAGPGMGGMMNLNMGMPGSLSGQMGMTTNLSSGNMNAQITVTRRQGGVMQVEMPGTDGGVPMTVTRPHVTTPSTAKASHDRRKQPANFACPVPGCGSTFTRHFNLKGHLRSHAEEKPYQCKWPGCGKGFARQHDCKRHEQLHLNIRPYPCEGCKKNFARMDALNRHLRSEGGAECRKIQEELQPGSTAHLDAPTATPSSDSGAESSAPPSGADVKPDPDGAWTAGGMMM